MFVLDIDEIREIASEIASKDVENEFYVLKNALLEKYGILLPEGIKTAAREKFGDIASAPILYENVTNSIIRKSEEEARQILTQLIPQSKNLISRQK